MTGCMFTCRLTMVMIMWQQFFMPKTMKTLEIGEYQSLEKRNRFRIAQSLQRARRTDNFELILNANHARKQFEESKTVLINFLLSFQ